MCAQGSTVEQRGYLIGEEIGQSAYVTVHLVEYTDETSTKKVRLACNIFSEENPTKCTSEKCIQRELDILTKIENSNIIHAYSILRRGAKIFIFMSLDEMAIFQVLFGRMEKFLKNKPGSGSDRWRVVCSISTARLLPTEN
jgi:hypothetical protein